MAGREVPPLMGNLQCSLLEYVRACIGCFLVSGICLYNCFTDIAYTSICNSYGGGSHRTIYFVRQVSKEPTCAKRDRIAVP